MLLLLLSIFFGAIGFFIGSALLGAYGQLFGGTIGFFAPSIIILWSIYNKVLGSEADVEIEVNNEEDDLKEENDLIGDEWKV